MRLDGEPDTAAVRDLACVLHGFLDGFEYAQQPEMQNLVEDLLLGIEIIIDAAGLDFGHRGDLA